MKKWLILFSSDKKAAAPLIESLKKGEPFGYTLNVVENSSAASTQLIAPEGLYYGAREIGRYADVQFGQSAA